MRSMLLIAVLVLVGGCGFSREKPQVAHNWTANDVVGMRVSAADGKFYVHFLVEKKIDGKLVDAELRIENAQNLIHGAR